MFTIQLITGEEEINCLLFSTLPKAGFEGKTNSTRIKEYIHLRLEVKQGSGIPSTNCLCLDREKIPFVKSREKNGWFKVKGTWPGKKRLVLELRLCKREEPVFYRRDCMTCFCIPSPKRRRGVI